MGWTSSKDTANQLTNSLQFSTKAEAISFAEREGFDWEVLQDHEPKVVKKSYADNYKWKGHPKGKAKVHFTSQPSQEKTKQDKQQTGKQ